MQTASSAKRTWREFRSASEYTATVAMPSSLHAQITRRAISPRLAIRILRNIAQEERTAPHLSLSRGADGKQRLPVFNGLRVFHEDPHHFPAHVGFDLIHQLHGLDDTQHLSDLH